MLRIRVTFPHGSYHATPWGHQVKEGHVEYPPSPWRLLRALLASWYKLSDRPNEQLTATLLTKLAEVLPTYYLPTITHSHTRQMVPVKPEKKDQREKLLRYRQDYRQEIFDAFYAIAEPLYIQWDVALTEEETALLQQLLVGISYLGRAESRAELDLVEECSTLPNAYPNPDGDTRVLCPNGITIENAINTIGVYTSDLQKKKYSGVPGTTWVNYQVKLPNQPRQKPTTSVSPPKPTLVRFVVGTHEPIHIRRALPLGDRLHRVLCAVGDSSTLTGWKGGEPRRDGNQHAYYIPEPDDFGFIRHLSVYAAEGFDADAMEALAKLPSRTPWLELCLIQVGKPEDYSDLRWWGNGKTWRSLTPVLLPRHPKRGKDGKLKEGYEEQVQRMLGYSGITTPCEVVLLPDPGEWQRFVRSCSSEIDRRGWGLELRFSEPVSGTIALGCSAHYGMGRFVCAD